VIISVWYLFGVYPSSVQDHTIYPSRIEHVFSYRKNKRNLKDYGRRSEEKFGPYQQYLDIKLFYGALLIILFQLEWSLTKGM
jgi:hypothetical protein